MDFGKVNHPRELDRISFELPPIEERGLQRLRGTPPQVYLGCPVWGKKDWLGTLYPKGTPAKQFLKYYSRQFNTIELNSTFYGTPDIATVENWRKETPTDFRFCPKFFQGVSRFENLREVPEHTHRFLNAILRFEEKLGTSFLQLPPSFGPDRLVILKRFFTLLPKHFQMSVEFRHPDWFREQQLIEPAYDLLAENGIGTVITDTACRRDVVHSSLTNQTIMIRFLGNALHPSDWSRVDGWVRRIGEWMKRGVHNVYFFLHQPEEDGVLELAEHFVARMNQTYSLSLRSWDKGIAQPQIQLFDV